MCLDGPEDDPPTLTEEQKKAIRQIARHTGADHRTVKRWAVGEAVTDVVDYALRAACRELSVTDLPRLAADQQGAA